MSNKKEGLQKALEMHIKLQLKAVKDKDEVKEKEQDRAIERIRRLIEKEL